MKIKLLVAAAFFIPALAMAQAPKIEPPVVAGTPSTTEVKTGINRESDPFGKPLPFAPVAVKPAVEPINKPAVATKPAVEPIVGGANIKPIIQ